MADPRQKPIVDQVAQAIREMAIDRRDHEAVDRRDVPRGGRRTADQILSAKDVLELAQREEFIALDVLWKALHSSRKVLLRDWESRRFPFTTVGRRILLPSSYVLRAYFSHVTLPADSHSSPKRPNEPTLS